MEMRSGSSGDGDGLDGWGSGLITYLVFLFPLVALLLCAGHLPLEVLCLDVDLSQPVVEETNMSARARHA